MGRIFLSHAMICCSRLRQLSCQVRPQGQIRFHSFGLCVDQGLSGQTVKMFIHDEAMRIAPAERQLVSYPCVDDTTQRWIIAVDNPVDSYTARYR